MNGTQSGKTFIFLFLAIILSIVLFLQSIFFNKTRHFRINILDLFLLIWCLYVFMDNYLQKVPFSLRLFEFYGLIILYITLRQTHRQYLIWFYVALILGGGIQAVYGSLQLCGYYTSNHGLFRITGSFFNPGPYAGYLAAAFPVSLGLFLFNPLITTPTQTVFLLKLDNYFGDTKSFFRKMSLIFRFLPNYRGGKFTAEQQSQRQKYADHLTMKSLVAISIIFICLVLPASHSRAAWLAVLISSFYLFSIKFRLCHRIQTYFDTWTKKLFLYASLLILLAISGAWLSHLKDGSFEGRLFIWKISMNMIRERPVTGYGIERFKAHYMDYQANWFAQNQAQEEAMVAGDTNYAFNEFVQYSVEYGILGLIIIASILIITFMSSGFRAPGTGSKVKTRNFYGVIAKAGIISILVFGMFSYPSQILPIKTNMVLYLATVAGLFSQKKISLLVSTNGRNRQHFSHSLRIIFLIAVLILVHTGNKYLYRYSKAYCYWKEAYQTYQMGAYMTCLEDYEKAWPVLKSNGDFLTVYGKALSMAGKHDKAVEVLLQAAKYYPNVVVYTALGDSYKQLGEARHAEQAYRYAWHMNPSRFYPIYLLAKLYDETGQREKAILTANELLRMQIKVPSTAIDEIKEEMQNIIKKYKDRHFK